MNSDVNKMETIDTHCHLEHLLQKGMKLEIVFQNMKKNGVIALIDSPINTREHTQSVNLHKKYPEKIFVTLGAAPANYQEVDIREIIESIRVYAKKNEIIGIGEVGLDYYWIKDEKLRKKQHLIFQEFIQLGNELKLPLIVHSRDAEKESIMELKLAETNVIMHSFSGNPDLGKECVEQNFYISIPTAITTRKKYQLLAKETPLESLIVETDSPFLSPIKELKINEPANVIYAIKEIAKIKGISIEEVAETVLENIKKIYRLNI